MKSRPYINVVDINRLSAFPEHRNCYNEVMNYIEDDSVKVCALYGLRRTGKTSLMTQIAKELSQKEKCLYFVCSCDEKKKIYPKMKDFLDMLEEAINEDYKYVFVDEMTFIKELQGQGAVLSDYYGAQGLKIIATGTDSLNYSFAADEMMYDRIKLVHTSYISFEEYNRLLGKDIDDYIAYGGTLMKESPYKSKKEMISYTNTSIVNNILHALENSENGEFPLALTELYDNEILESAINRCINQMNQHFTIKALTKMYESGPLHTGINNAAHDFPYARYIDIEKVDETLKDILKITNDTPIPMKPEHLEAIKGYLQDLDLLQIIPEYRNLKDLSGKEDVELITQAGMIYCHATELIKILSEKDSWANKCGTDIKTAFLECVDRQVKGCILENVLITDFYNSLDNNTYYVSKLSVEITPQNRGEKNKSFDVLVKNDINDVGHIISERMYGKKESDIIITEKSSGNTYLFEVKYSGNIEDSHTKNLRNDEFLNYIEHNFGEISGRFVLYNGENASIKDDHGLIYFISASEILKQIPKMENNIQILLNNLHLELYPLKGDFSIIKECPFKSQEELSNWQINEEQLIQSRYADEMNHLEKLWNDGLGEDSGNITMDEYVTRKKIAADALSLNKNKLTEKYEQFKPFVKTEPDLSIEQKQKHTLKW